MPRRRVRKFSTGMAPWPSLQYSVGAAGGTSFTRAYWMRLLRQGTETKGDSPVWAALKRSQQAATLGWLIDSRSIQTSLALLKERAFSITRVTPQWAAWSARGKSQGDRWAAAELPVWPAAAVRAESSTRAQRRMRAASSFHRRAAARAWRCLRRRGIAKRGATEAI